MAFDATVYASSDLYRWISPKDYGADGSSITSLLDKSGNSDHLSSVSGTVTVDDNYFPSGAKAIKFASGAKANDGSGVSLGTSYSIYFVSQGTTASTGSYQGLIDGDIGSSRRFQFRHDNGGIKSISFHNNTSTNYQASASSVDELNPQIYCMIAEPGTGGVKLYEDNVEIASSDGGNSTSAPQIGVNSASNIAGGERRYGDIVIYSSAHDATTRTNIYDDLYADYIAVASQEVYPDSITSGLSDNVGEPVVALSYQIVEPDAIASTESAGSPEVLTASIVEPDSIASAASLGSPTVAVIEVFVVEPDSIASAESFGSPEIILDPVIYPDPITDTVFGTLEFNAGAQYVYPDPIEPETAIGNVEVSGGSLSSEANESVLVVTGSAYIDISAFRLI